MEREKLDYAAGRVATLGGEAPTEAGYLLLAHLQFKQAAFIEAQCKR